MAKYHVVEQHALTMNITYAVDMPEDAGSIEDLAEIEARLNRAVDEINRETLTHNIEIIDVKLVTTRSN